jgi:hypothetical protein
MEWNLFFKCAKTKFAQKPIKSTITNLCIPKSQIIKSDLKHTSWDYIPSMKWLKPHSHLNMFQVKANLNALT